MILCYFFQNSFRINDSICPLPSLGIIFFYRKVSTWLSKMNFNFLWENVKSFSTTFQNWHRLFSSLCHSAIRRATFRVVLGTSKARGTRDNHYETHSLLVPSSFPARLKIRPLVVRKTIRFSTLLLCYNLFTDLSWL